MFAYLGSSTILLLRNFGGLYIASVFLTDTITFKSKNDLQFSKVKKLGGYELIGLRKTEQFERICPDYFEIYHSLLAQYHNTPLLLPPPHPPPKKIT